MEDLDCEQSYMEDYERERDHARELLAALKSVLELLTDQGIVNTCEDNETDFSTLIHAATCLFNSQQVKHAMKVIKKVESE